MENFGEGLYMLEMGDFYNQAISLVCPFFAIRCSTTYKVSMSPYHWRSPLLVADCNSGPVSWPLLVLVVQPSVCPGCWRRVLSSEESADLPDNSELDYLIGLLGSFVINIRSTSSPLHALLVQLRLRKHKPLLHYFTILGGGGRRRGDGGEEKGGGANIWWLYSSVSRHRISTPKRRYLAHHALSFSTEFHNSKIIDYLPSSQPKMKHKSVTEY